MVTTTIPVRSPSAEYEVHIGPDLLRSLYPRIAALHGKPHARVFVVTSPRIWELHGEALSASFPTPPTVLQILAGEQYKRLATVERLAEQLAAERADRDSLLIAFGGGVIGDITGFLAAIWMRGVPYVQVPTTALAQIDSSVGGKTGVNLAAGKNLIGSFHHPLVVFADVDTLTTLPASELRAGLQEAIKAGIIRDHDLFSYIEAHADSVLAGDPEALTHVIAQAVRMKAAVVAEDERETGVRMLLNLGHTLGHAIEAATSYAQLLHGEAVAWGMLAATHIARKRGLLSSSQAERIHRLVERFGPLRPFTSTPERLVELTARDKKHRSGVRSFILPVGIGDASVFRDVSEDELLEAAASLFPLMDPDRLQPAQP